MYTAKFLDGPKNERGKYLVNRLPVAKVEKLMEVKPMEEAIEKAVKL